MVEIRHLPHELQITMDSDIIGDVEKEEVISEAVFNYFGAHFMQKYLGPARAAAMTTTTTQGKTDADDDNSDSAEFGPDIDEDVLINEKTDFKKS